MSFNVFYKINESLLKSVWHEEQIDPFSFSPVINRRKSAPLKTELQNERKQEQQQGTHSLAVSGLSGGELFSVLLELLHLEHLADFVWYNTSQRCVCSLPRGFRAGLPAAETLEKMLFLRFMVFFFAPLLLSAGRDAYLVRVGAKKATWCLMGRKRPLVANQCYCPHTISKFVFTETKIFQTNSCQG